MYGAVFVIYICIYISYLNDNRKVGEGKVVPVFNYMLSTTPFRRTGEWRYSSIYS
jgi:hypothetical protein